MPERIDATIQARMGSSRLPGKVLLPVAGQPLLARIVERIRRSRLIDRVIIATSSSGQDDPVAELAERLGCLCFRGSEDDVLGRVTGTLKAFDVDIHVEFQGDNALPDPLLIDAVVGYYLKFRDEYDYVTTALRTTYPPGSEVTVYAASTLIRAEAEWEPGRPREHVGPHIYQRPERFRCCNLEAPPAYHYPDIHLEVDTIEDYQVVCRLYEHFLPGKPDFTLAEAIDYALQSGIWRNNADVPRRWRSYRSDGGAE
jgi:spore coat polysaccharide biosynthesis protein SpsF